MTLICVLTLIPWAHIVMWYGMGLSLSENWISSETLNKFVSFALFDKACNLLSFKYNKSNVLQQICHDKFGFRLKRDLGENLSHGVTHFWWVTHLK